MNRDKMVLNYQVVAKKVIENFIKKNLVKNLWPQQVPLKNKGLNKKT
jgi:hypothetical protein